MNFAQDSMALNSCIVNKNGFNRLHAIDWFTDVLQPEFSVRQIQDCLDSGQLLIRRKNRPGDLWTPVHVKTFTRYRGTSQSVFKAGDGYSMNAFHPAHRSKNACLFLVGSTPLAQEMEQVVIKTYGRVLGTDFATRFRNFPVDSISMHCESADFHPLRPLRMREDNTLGDPAVHCHSLHTLPPAIIQTRLLALKTRLWHVLDQRETSGVMHPYYNYFSVRFTRPDSKQIEGIRFLLMRRKCFCRGLVPYSTMRGGSVDFNILRKKNIIYETISIQMKSFSGIGWEHFQVDVGSVVMENHFQIDLLLIIQSLPGQMVLFFVDWRHYHFGPNRTVPDGVFTLGSLTNQIPSFPDATESDHITQMVFPVDDGVQLDSFNDDADDADPDTIHEYGLKIDKFFRPPNYLENLYISNGEFNLELEY